MINSNRYIYGEELKLTQDIYIKTYQTHDGSLQLYDAVTAIRLLSCPTVRLFESSGTVNPLPLISKQIDFINTLHRANVDVTYGLRYISHPNPVSISSGNIDICVFCKTSDSSITAAADKVLDQTDQLIIQLCASFPDYSWQVVKRANDFQSLWKPFGWERADIIEIRRREEIVSLASIRSAHRMGFTSPLDQYEESEETLAQVYFVHPFLTHPGQLERFLRVMLLNQAPAAFTVILNPTRLTREEEQAFINEISCCEGFQPITTRNLQRIQEQRARMLSKGLMEQLLSLQDAPFHLTISLACAGKISPSLAETAGVAVSAPVGEGPNPLYKEQALIQMGGYDIAVPANEREKAVALRNVATLNHEDWGLTLAGNELKRIRYLVDGHEAAAAFRFPEDFGDGLPGISTHTQRIRPLSLELVMHMRESGPKRSLLLGTNTYLGIPQEVSIPEKDRLTHMYIVGQTGTGKSTLLKTMILSDMNKGRGCALVDPHGDLFEEILTLIPPKRIDDVVIIDPADVDYPIGLNLLEIKSGEEREFVVREMQAIIRRLLEDEYGAYGREMMGPIFFTHFQMNMLLAMSDPDHPGTLIEFYQIFQSPNYWKRWIPLKTDDPQLVQWIESTLSQNTYTQPPKDSSASLGSYISSKFSDFTFDPRLRRIFGQPRSTVDIQQIMNEGKILLVNLAKGFLGEANSRFLGFILMAKIQAEAMKRAKLPKSKRTPFYLYVDEFQSLATENFTVMLSEARKFGCGLVLANQFISQIQDSRIVQAIFGNVGSILAFRLGREDAQFIEPQFLPIFDRMDLINLPNWQLAVRTSINGKSLPPFTLHTILPSVKPDLNIAKRARDLSRSKYSRSKTEVDRIIAQSMSRLPLDLSF